MNLSQSISSYVKQLQTGKTKARLLKTITVSDKKVKKGTVSSLFFQKDNGKFHFETSELNIAFEVDSTEFEYVD